MSEILKPLPEWDADPPKELGGHPPYPVPQGTRYSLVNRDGRDWHVVLIGDERSGAGVRFELDVTAEEWAEGVREMLRSYR